MNTIPEIKLQQHFLNINDYSLKIKGLLIKLKYLKIEIQNLYEQRAVRECRILCATKEIEFQEKLSELAILLGLPKLKTTRNTLSVSEAKKQGFLPSKENFLKAFAHIDLKTGKRASSDFTFEEIIQKSGDIERYTKLFNKLYNNTIASTGPYTMDMFIYNRAIVFKARKRIQVVSTFPNIKPADSYPTRNIKYSSGFQTDFSCYFEYKKDKSSNLSKLTILEYIFRKLFKSPNLGSKHWVESMDRLKTILERDQEYTLRSLFEKSLSEEQFNTLTLKEWSDLMNELYIQDSLDEDFKSYIKKYIIKVNSDTLTDQQKNHLIRDYIVPFIPSKGGNKQRIKVFSGNSQRKMIFTLTNASARWNSMITLTYPKVFPKDGIKAKSHLNTFLVMLKHYLGKDEPVKYFWWMEFQERGAMHYHIYTEFTKDQIDSTPLRMSWNEIAGKQFTSHKIYGFQVKDLSTVSQDNIVDYAVSYAKSQAGYLNDNSEIILVDGKLNKRNSPKHAQKLVPDTIYNPGRFWGASRKLAQCKTILIDAKCMFAGLIKRLKEAGYKHFYLPFYLHRIQAYDLDSIAIEHTPDETNKTILGKLTLSYAHDNLFIRTVQGKNSYIPTFDWTTKQLKNKSFIKEFIDVTITKKQKTKLLDPTIKITPKEALDKIRSLDIMSCDIFLLFAYWRVFQRHWHFDKMNPSTDCIIC